MCICKIYNKHASQCREVISIWNQLHLIPEDMRGIGIQISNLEICKTKQNKDNIINFFNKMKKLQPYDKKLENDNKNQCDFNNEIKSDSSKVLSTIESTTINFSDTRNDNNLPLKSLRISESISSHENGYIAISDIRAERSTENVIEMKNKNSYNRKVDKNINKVKDLSWKSNKNATQRQTSQENFFRHSKPKTRNLSKYEMPRMQDIDMSVLVELPEDIRNEIFDEYKRNKKQSQIDIAIDTTNLTDTANVVAINEKDSNTQHCSQVDPDILAALMKSDLHPDVQRDVQIYCDMKREVNKINFKETNEQNLKNLKSIEQLQETDLSAKIDNNSKNVKSIIDDTYTEAADIMLHTRYRLHEKDNIDETRSTMRKVNDIEILHNNAVMDKADTFILQNLNILHNDENVDKHQEMLINLVNHLFTLPLHQVPHNYLFR